MIFLTFDIDWAPDFMIDFVASILEERGLSATWFVTHQSGAIKKLKKNKNFELGIHPNFLPGSTQGRTQEEVISNLLTIVPDAVSMRTHSMFWSGSLLDLILSKTSLKIDSSLFLPTVSPIHPFRHWVHGKYIIRVPFYWIDDFQWQKPAADWDIPNMIRREGLRVISFHPVHIYLNSPHAGPYENLLRKNRDIAAVTPETARCHVCEGNGTGTFFLKCVDYIAKTEKSLCIRDIMTECKNDLI